MVPEKFDFIKLWQFAQKTRWQVLEVRAMAVRQLTYCSRPKPSHSKIRRIWRTGFYIDECATVQTVALKRPIFKWKKGFATISLGLPLHGLIS
jgi:hypothetical protein